MNSNGDIHLWTFVSAKLLPPAVNSTFQVFMVFSIKFITSSVILYNKAVYYLALRDHIIILKNAFKCYLLNSNS